MRLDEDERPEVLGARSLAGSIAVHVAFFLVIWIGAKAVSRPPDEIAVPIDLLVVVNENLDGKENEPPPVQEPPKPQEEKPKPRTAPPKPPDPPKEEVDAVEKVPEKPKKTAAELQKERMERIRESLKNKPKDPPKEKPKEKPKTREELIRESLKGKPTNAKVTIKVDAPSGDGKTAKKTLTDAEIRKLLGEGYRPGATTQLAASEEQRCLSLIYNAFYSKWTRPAWNDTLREMHLSVSFGSGGRVTGYKLVQSSGDAAADRCVLLAASLVQVVSGLSDDFVRKHKHDIVLRFKVTPL